MPETHHETVTDVRHWTDTLFSFRTTRDSGLRFRNGEFTMIGIEVNGKPLLRAYSMTSSNYEDFLEFYSIKVQDGPLTSRLQHVRKGDSLIVSKKPTGTLLWDHLRPGRSLYMLGTGTGIAPFLSVMKDPDIYENFEKVVLVHGCRYARELAYGQLMIDTLRNNEYFGDIVRGRLLHYPTVTREPYEHTGRITDLMESGRLFRDIGATPFEPDDDRVMLCGSPGMLKSLTDMLHRYGFTETRKSDFREYVIERAFVDK